MNTAQIVAAVIFVLLIAGFLYKGHTLGYEDGNVGIAYLYLLAMVLCLAGLVIDLIIYLIRMVF